MFASDGNIAALCSNGTTGIFEPCGHLTIGGRATSTEPSLAMATTGCSMPQRKHNLTSRGICAQCGGIDNAGQLLRSV